MKCNHLLKGQDAFTAFGPCFMEFTLNNPCTHIDSNFATRPSVLFHPFNTQGFVDLDRKPKMGKFTQCVK